MNYELTVLFFQDSKDNALLFSEPMISDEKFRVICIIVPIILFYHSYLIMSISVSCVVLFYCLFCVISFDHVVGLLGNFFNARPLPKPLYRSVYYFPFTVFGPSVCS